MKNERNYKYIGRGIAAAGIALAAVWLEISGIDATLMYFAVFLLVLDLL